MPDNPPPSNLRRLLSAEAARRKETDPSERLLPEARGGRVSRLRASLRRPPVAWPSLS